MGAASQSHADVCCRQDSGQCLHHHRHAEGDLLGHSLFDHGGPRRHVEGNSVHLLFDHGVLRRHVEGNPLGHLLFDHGVRYLRT